MCGKLNKFTRALSSRVISLGQWPGWAGESRPATWVAPDPAHLKKKKKMGGAWDLSPTSPNCVIKDV